MSRDNIQLLEELLNHNVSNQFACEVYKSIGGQNNHFPSNEEVIAHLKVLKSFQVLKVNVVGNPTEESFDDSFFEFSAKQVKIWQAYLTNATRRFIIFMSSLKYKFKFNEPFLEEPLQLLNFRNHITATNVADFCRRNPPPMDVLMIWHAFALNPKSFYDNGIRNNFIEFTFCPFPLFQILQFIDNKTFEYCPSSACINNFETLTKQFGIPLQFNFQFDISSSFPIYCPQCEHLLGRASLTNQLCQGFADPGFLVVVDANSKCTHQTSNVITHLELRKRQFLSDLKKECVPLPNVTKQYSSILSNKSDKNLVSYIDQKIKKAGLLYRQFLIDSQDVSSFAQTVQRTRPKESTLQLTRIMELYDYMNLIHLTVPPRHGVVHISEDLVACTARQERFVAKMNSFNWLNQVDGLIQTVERSITRYHRFLHLLIEYYKTQMLVPTMDIDLVWHTHQLSPLYYIQYCRSHSGLFVIDHDDKVNELKISAHFEHTGFLYKQKYNEDYLICLCWYCTIANKKNESEVGSLFVTSLSLTNLQSLTPRTGSTTPISTMSNYTQKKSLFGQVNSSHILAHNAVRFSKKKDSAIYNTKNRNGGRSLKRPYPWNNSNPETISLNKYGSVFALDPIVEEGPTCTLVSDMDTTASMLDDQSIDYQETFVMMNAEPYEESCEDQLDYLPTPSSTQNLFEMNNDVLFITK